MNVRSDYAEVYLDDVVVFTNTWEERSMRHLFLDKLSNMLVY